MAVKFTSKSLSVNASPTSLAAADLNGDGKLDLLVGSAVFATSTTGSTTDSTIGSTTGSTGKLTAFLGDGAGQFGAAVVSTSPQFGAVDSITVGDFNQDGIPDLITTGALAANTSNLFVSLGNGQGEFTPAASLRVGTDQTGAAPVVAAGDLNGDGRWDVVTADRQSQTVSLLLGDGSSFSPGRNLPLGGNPLALQLQDLNGDGRLDLAIVTHQPSSSQVRLTVLLGNGQGDFAAGASPVLSQGKSHSAEVADLVNVAAITTGDFDRDGQIEIAVSAAGKLSLLKGDPSQRLEPVYQLNQAATSLHTGDFNGDGQLDLASVGIGYNTYRAGYYLGSGNTILLGNGSGQFSRPAVYQTDLSEMPLVAGDFDQNGQPDLALASPSLVDRNNVSVLLNRTTQTAAITTGETNRLFGKRKTFVDASSELRASVTIDLEARKLVLNTPQSFRQILAKQTVEAVGTRRNDILRARRSDSFLNGGGGSDQLVGRSGRDRLLGGAGNDELIGGAGRDRFIFSATPNYPEGLETPFQKARLGVDQIVDFERGDQIVLDAGTFTRLRTGQKLRFSLVDSLREAKSSPGLITYSRDTGQLYYNANGRASGFGQGGLFAVLANQPQLEARDLAVFL